MSEARWAEHLRAEFETKDVEATLATMVDDASVTHMPVGTGHAAVLRQVGAPLGG